MKRASDTPRVHASVRDAVLAWVKATNVRSAAERLKNARRSLSNALIPELEREVAEITMETLFELLVRRDRVDPRQETVEIMGLILRPAQIERLSAWAHDQPRIAEALQLRIERWLQLLESSAHRMMSQPGVLDAKKMLAIVPRRAPA
jgi:hypothetical protein